MFLGICDLGFVIAGILRLNLIAQRSTLVFVPRYLEFSSSLLCLMIMSYMSTFYNFQNTCIMELVSTTDRPKFRRHDSKEVVSSSDALSGSVTSGTKKRKYQTEESKKMKRPEITTMPAKDQWKSYLYSLMERIV